MKIDELKKLKNNFFPGEIRLADNRSEGKKTLFRMPDNGEIVEPGTKGAIEYRRFWAMISTERKDTCGTILTRNGVVSAFLDWLDAGGGNVRIMHQPEAVGHIFKDDYEIRAGGIYAGFSIPITESKTLDKIDSGLIRFVSLGFNYNWDSDSIEILDDGETIKVKRLSIVELTIGDFGSTPGTEIQEERTANSESLIMKTYNAVKRLAAKLDPGGTPIDTNSNMEDQDMTPEQFKTMMDAQAAHSKATLEAITGALKPLTEAQRVAQGKPTKTDGDENPEPTMKEVLAQLAATNQRLADLGKGVTTGSGLPSTTITPEEIEKNIADMEAGIELIKSQEPSDNQRLSFISAANSGKPITLETLRRTE